MAGPVHTGSGVGVNRASGALVIALSVMVGCASNPPATVVTAPRYPSYPEPVVPAGLDASQQLRSRHTSAWQRLQAGEQRELGSERREHSESWFRCAAGAPGGRPAANLRL